MANAIFKQLSAGAVNAGTTFMTSIEMMKAEMEYDHVKGYAEGAAAAIAAKVDADDTLSQGEHQAQSTRSNAYGEIVGASTQLAGEGASMATDIAGASAIKDASAEKQRLQEAQKALRDPKAAKLKATNKPAKPNLAQLQEGLNVQNVSKKITAKQVEDAEVSLKKANEVIAHYNNENEYGLPEVNYQEAIQERDQAQSILAQSQAHEDRIETAKKAVDEWDVSQGVTQGMQDHIEVLKSVKGDDKVDAVLKEKRKQISKEIDEKSDEIKSLQKPYQDWQQRFQSLSQVSNQYSRAIGATQGADQTLYAAQAGADEVLAKSTQQLASGAMNDTGRVADNFAKSREEIQQVQGQIIASNRN
jgi:hypothetical protein